jgi:RND family efflux transporter MFP subunit
MKSRLLILLVFVGVLGLVGLVALFRAGQRRDEVAAVTVRRQPVRTLRLAPDRHVFRERFYGFVEAAARVEMAFQIDGRIDRLGPSQWTPLKEGDKVEKGSVIARVEPRRFEAALAQARAMQREAEAMGQEANAQIVDAESRLADAEREHRRLQQLFDRGAGNQRGLDKGRMGEEVANAALMQARARLASATAGYNAARAAADLAQVRLDDATLLAPMNALVAEVPIEIGQLVTAGRTAMTLVDIDTVKLVVGVVERKVPLVEVGQTASVQILALDGSAGETGREVSTLTGKISIVPPAADPTTRLFNVEIEIANPDHRLKPGMVGRAGVAVGSAQAFSVPAEAVIREDERCAVFFVTHGRRDGSAPNNKTADSGPPLVARRVVFTPLAEDGDRILAASFPGDLDQLIVEGHTRLEDGQPVRIVDQVARATGDDDDRMPKAP